MPDREGNRPGQVLPHLIYLVYCRLSIHLQPGVLCCSQHSTDESADTLVEAWLPGLVDLPVASNAVAIAAGSRHSVAVMSCGAAFTWGWGESPE